MNPVILRPPRGVWEARLHQSYKSCVIGAILSQTYGIFQIFVMGLLQWHKVSKTGEDEHHRAPVVALMWYDNCYARSLLKLLVQTISGSNNDLLHHYRFFVYARFALTVYIHMHTHFIHGNACKTLLFISRKTVWYITVFTACTEHDSQYPRIWKHSKIGMI